MAKTKNTLGNCAGCQQNGKCGIPQAVSDGYIDGGDAGRHCHEAQTPVLAKAVKDGQR